MIRLLIADDEKLEREALAELVQRRFEREVVLEVAENGRKAADTAVLWGADLILMDIEMPGMSGLDAARAVLAQRPSCRVIFVTAYSLFQYAHEAVHLGACDYLLKPVDPDELEASVRRAMRQIETERKLEELAAAQPQPEQTETEEEAEDAPEESENSQTALVMAHVRRYLEDNYMFDLSLDSVGEILHISPAYLSAQFKKYQKMNFLDCLTELRINAAKELLADPFRSSAEVASMVGYEDASYFARAFKKRTGMTPTQYRRQAGREGKGRPGGRAVSGRMISRRSVLALAACTALGAVGCSKTEEYTGSRSSSCAMRRTSRRITPPRRPLWPLPRWWLSGRMGRVKVVVYSGGELGGELSVIEQMQFGGIDFARVSLSQLSEYQPALSVLQLPFLYTDAPQMWRVLDGEIGDEFLSGLGAIDLVGLSWFDAGVRSFYTREKVETLADLAGLTLRVQESDMMSEMILDLGAKPAQVVYSRVYAALHNAEIDGAENNWPSYEAMGHYEVAPYFLKDEHTRVPELQLASEAAMEKLAELDERFPDIIRACGKESALAERRLWAEREASAEKHMREWGVEVTILSAAEKARFRAAVEPVYAAFEEQSRLIQRIREA